MRIYFTPPTFRENKKKNEEDVRKPPRVFLYAKWDLVETVTVVVYSSSRNQLVDPALCMLLENDIQWYVPFWPPQAGKPLHPSSTID